MGNEELERRVSALEAEMADVRELAAGADADVSRLDVVVRAQVRTMSALRKNQIELQKQQVELHLQVADGFAEMREGFAAMRDGFAYMGRRFDGADHRLDTLESSNAMIIKRLGGLSADGDAPA